ncbi:hypothetical protein KY290_021329 [Solanum tuberosum]|uniref:Uncharacterized protein n=1 Tax=Solanum tuberosum TaxID=4113 RepID=A0ABQ7V388_SOLTU|nr:hypothetical protein KY289_020485 [Solanum tuberosum]KAH0757836.1 hypothetical protein KY290_021329 [Solanum tuberosum]
MQDCNGVSTPMSSSESLMLNDSTPSHDATEYRKVIRKLQYLSFTMPDVSYSMNKLSQFMHAPSEAHWRAVKRLIRYLKSIAHYGIRITQRSSLNLSVFYDVDWVGNLSDRSSTTGYIIFLGLSPVSWSSKQQRIIARSSTEAEYRDVASAIDETIWVKNLLKELHVKILTPPTIFCDNLGVTYLYENNNLHSRMKHIAVHFHYIRQQVNDKHLTFKHILSSYQLADSLTNRFQEPHFIAICPS